MSHRRRMYPLERDEQATLRAWVDIHWWRDWWIHVPNERKDRREAQFMSAAGVRAGVPDNLLFLPRGNYVGAASELKRRNARPSDTRPEQRAWLERLREAGWYVGVHRGADEAMGFFCDYIAHGEPRHHRGPAA